MIRICTECPTCKEEIELKHEGDRILIGDEGDTVCPKCGNQIHYEIRVNARGYKPAERKETV